MLIKPEEIILHRPHLQGGIGLHSVKFKCMAGFITSFLHTATNPEFCPLSSSGSIFFLRRNVLHSEESPQGILKQYHNHDIKGLVQAVHRGVHHHGAQHGE